MCGHQKKCCWREPGLHMQHACPHAVTRENAVGRERSGAAFLGVGVGVGIGVLSSHLTSLET